MSYFSFRKLTILAICFLQLNVSAQVEQKKWSHSILVEVDVLEITGQNFGQSNPNLVRIKYDGQTLRYSLKRNLSHRFSAGIETGIFYNFRYGNAKVISHSYIPVQLAIRLTSKKQRFAFSLQCGIPFMLTNKYNYLGSAGLWYRDIKKNTVVNEDLDFIQAQYRILDKYHLVSGMRFHFTFEEMPNTYFHLGLQNYIYSSHAYKAGTASPNTTAEIGTCFNFLFGMSRNF